MMSSVARAMCWTPGPPWKRRYSSICERLRPRAGSLIGSLMRAWPSATTLGHQRGVLGADVLVVERGQEREPEDPLVEADPVLHPAFLDVGDDVVDRRQADRVERVRAVTVGLDRFEARGEHAAVAAPINEGIARCRRRPGSRRRRRFRTGPPGCSAALRRLPRGRGRLHTSRVRSSTSKARVWTLSPWATRRALSGCSAVSGEVRTKVISPWRST